MATIWLPERDFLFSGVFYQHGFQRNHGLSVSLLEGVGVDVHSRGSLCMTQAKSGEKSKRLGEKNTGGNGQYCLPLSHKYRK